jgi:hypothetical protein
MSQANATATTIRPAAPAEPEVSTAKIIALLGGLQARRINVVRGASYDDILNVQDDIAHAFDLLAAYVGRSLVNLNANLSCSGLIEFDDAMSLLADARSDLCGSLTNAAERWVEENGQFGMGA